MVVEWTNGGPQNLLANLQLAANRVVASTKTALEDVTTEAEADMKAIITSSTTVWGEKRKAEGRASDGRIETSDMIDSVTSETESDANSMTGTWGWIDNFEDYFFFQEDGTEHIDAMHALSGSFTKAQEDLKEKLGDIV